MAMPTDIGIIDLQLGFPHTSVEAKKATYDFFRPLLKDEQSARDFEFPAEYMFKGVPDLVPPDTDVVQWTVDHMDRFGIAVAMTGVGPRGIEARERFPDRFVLSLSVWPNQGVDAIRAITRAHEEHGIVSVMCFPCGQVPQVNIDDPLMYPIYMRGVERGLHGVGLRLVGGVEIGVEAGEAAACEARRGEDGRGVGDGPAHAAIPPAGSERSRSTPVTRAA